MAAQDAMGSAATGFAIAGPMGAAFGAVAGGLMGASGRSKAREANRAQRRAMQAQMKRDLRRQAGEQDRIEGQDIAAIGGSGVTSGSGTVQSQRGFMRKEHARALQETEIIAKENIATVRAGGQAQQAQSRQSSMINTFTGLSNAAGDFFNG